MTKEAATVMACPSGTFEKPFYKLSNDNYKVCDKCPFNCKECSYDAAVKGSVCRVCQDPF